ncbi:class I SAM-dependent methyltransferase [Phenylobacterium sp. J426]|uniref:class I SAM-dependent methyltransferase n=1 Tax=Phenylobacterium sp. J426 TaxID=2898439 RepID=UPI002150FF04|nr:class I SAM-dependent methyltransferase [Phenylobacterium sp. J426]MCR5876514.1 class I SAM-dependent methyltransferase [Phenylobacterium sp. J426]
MSALEIRLARFPKTRPPLPPKIAEIYARQYAENRAGETTAASLSQRLEQWMHRQVAADASPAKATLELGAGNLNQLPFEPEGGIYDIVEPFAELFEDSPRLARVRKVYADVAEVPGDARYDRITSVACLEHITDLPVALARSARLLASGGSFRAAIPAEGGFLWKLGWSMTTGLEFRLRHGEDYGLLMAHEHVNEAAEIEALCKALFEHVSVKSFGLGRQLSLYRFIEAGKPRLDVAEAWLTRYAA